LFRRIVSYFYTEFLHLFLNVHVPYTNGMWLIRTNIVKTIKIKSNGNTCTAETIIRAGMKGYKIGSCPFLLRESSNNNTSAVRFLSILSVIGQLFYLFLYSRGDIKEKENQNE